MQNKKPAVRIMPQAQEIEQAVIGALLIESSALGKVIDFLTPEDFYNKHYAFIYSAIVKMSVEKKPIDMLTVVEEMQGRAEFDKMGGIPFIASITQSVVSSTHIDYHSKIIKQKSIARQLIAITAETYEKCFDPSNDIDDIIEQLDMAFTQLMANTSTEQSKAMPQVMKETIDKINKAHTDRENGVSPGIPTHLEALDKVLHGGWQTPDLIVIGARPSMGKTQHALQIAETAARHNRHTLFCTIEMVATQLGNRLILANNKINEANIRKGSLSQEEWFELDLRVSEINNIKLRIADHHAIRMLSNIKAEARRLKRKSELDLLIIDYLGLIKTNLKFGLRQQEIAYITGELKALAKELSIPVILLSQLSRAQKNAPAREPVLEDLRESGDIEQDADIVLMLHKPDYYDKDAVASNGMEWKNRGKIIVAKNREGNRNVDVIFEHDSRYKNIFACKHAKS
ncbi:replicative DNA helicase [Dysgonomonadaceae bacterium PH5-43]|nr:replicative DNA helicase [Dysgonomonadaceae bacterium PH5-43]